MIINRLMESKLFRSKTALESITARQAADMLQMHICALMILRSSPLTEDAAIAYAKKTLTNGNLKHFSQSATDLGILAWALLTEDCEFRLPTASDKVRGTLTIDETMLRMWLKSVGSPKLDKSLSKRMFTKLDNWLKVEDAGMKAIRRLVQDWSALTKEEASLSITRLLQLFRTHAYKSDLLMDIQKVAHSHGLEIADACNPETGDGCGSEKDSDHKEKKSSNLFKKIGAIALGGLIGYKASKALGEDADAGVTSSTSIAPVVQPLGGVMRRGGYEPIATHELKHKRSKKKRSPK
jgi:hypothetical protein